MKTLSSILDIIPNYDAFLLDLWGVVHDGSQLYDGVRETLLALKKANKKVIFISNAPRRASNVASVLTSLGIEPALYDHIISSGEVGFHWLEAGKSPWGNRYYLIAAEKDMGLLNGLNFKQVSDLKNADFVLNLGFGTEEQTSEDYAPVLRDAAQMALPMLCLNPDLEVIKISGGRFPCAGALAKEYMALGGKVEWFGKPFPAVYEYAHKLLDGIDKQQILAVGDSLETDIPGAKKFGVDCLLVTGGILKGKDVAEIKKICSDLALNPTYLIPQFGIQ
jgi:HAD superfamily hydrolase (TIGR01459 family)